MIVLFATLTLAAPSPPSLGELLFGGAGQLGRCDSGVTKVEGGSAPAQFGRLGDLPDAHMELPVVRYLRQNGACRAAPLIVRYKVSR